MAATEIDGNIIRQVELAFRERERLKDFNTRDAVTAVIEALDKGKVRVAEKHGEHWKVNAWVKEAILLYFAMRPLEAIEAGEGVRWYDKIPLKTDWEAAGVRSVPPGAARYGSFVEPGAILMPSYVNIGAHVGHGTMVDTWATVGSCAQIGADVMTGPLSAIKGLLKHPLTDSGLEQFLADHAKAARAVNA